MTATMPDVPADFPVRPLGPNDPAKDRVTCGGCGRSWDDAIPTRYTPAPSARCPFELYHAEEPPAKKPRRKWRFSSREAAEAEAVRAGASETRQAIFINAVTNDPAALKWFRGRSYHVAYWGATRADQGIYALRFMAPDNPGQKPTVCLYDRSGLDQFRRELTAHRLKPDAELNELVRLIDSATMSADAELRASFGARGRHHDETADE